MAKVPELDEVLATHDFHAVRLATRAALERGVAAEDVAESMVAYCEQRRLAGDKRAANEVLFDAVHDGIPIDVLYDEIKAMVRKPKER